jgi:hypothetical protein
MSKKSNARKKKAKKAKLKVLHVNSLTPETHFVALELKDAPEPTASTWSKISKFMGWS